MRIEDLDFDYPERLVATERVPESRVMLMENGEPRELSGVPELLKLFRQGDVLVVNNTRVLKRRVFTESGLEILFLNPTSAPSLMDWSVLCPSSRWKAGTEQGKAGTEQVLPGGVRLELIQRGRPQVIRASEPLTDEYFEKHGEMPLPPYIQKARGERHNRSSDSNQYQTAWAERDGSLAAPTASLHFSNDDISQLKSQGVDVLTVTLHVGLGTFLPVTAENLDEHVMHAEAAEVPAQTWERIQKAKAEGARVWAMGTTVTRTLEAAAHGKLSAKAQGGFFGETDLFIRPGFEFRVIDGLLTNFHQPRSTLLALVSAFAGLETVKRAYAWAIEKNFRLFSYGDLTVWIK